MADGVLVAEHAVGQGCAENHRRIACLSLAFSEDPSGDDRDPHGPEIAGADQRKATMPPFDASGGRPTTLMFE